MPWIPLTATLWDDPLAYTGLLRRNSPPMVIKPPGWSTSEEDLSVGEVVERQRALLPYLKQLMDASAEVVTTSDQALLAKQRNSFVMKLSYRLPDHPYAVEDIPVFVEDELPVLLEGEWGIPSALFDPMFPVKPIAEKRAAEVDPSAGISKQRFIELAQGFRPVGFEQIAGGNIDDIASRVAKEVSIDEMAAKAAKADTTDVPQISMGRVVYPRVVKILHDFIGATEGPIFDVSFAAHRPADKDSKKRRRVHLGHTHPEPSAMH